MGTLIIFPVKRKSAAPKPVRQEQITWIQSDKMDLNGFFEEAKRRCDEAERRARIKLVKPSIGEQHE